MPADIEFKLEGIEDLVAKSGLLNAKVGSIVRDLLTKSASGIERKAKQLAPVDTGRLKASIAHTVGAGNVPMWAMTGTNVKYARPVEYGTKPHWAPLRAFQGWAQRHHANEAAVWWSVGKKGTKAHPYLRPAFEESKPDIEGHLEGAKAAIEDIWQ